MLFFARIVFSFVFGYCNVYKMSVKHWKENKIEPRMNELNHNV